MNDTHIDHDLKQHLERRNRLQVALFATLVGTVPILLGAYFLRHLMAPVAAVPQVRMFAATFMGIFLEAMPFVLLGSLMSGLIEVFVSPELMARFIPKRRLAQLALGALIGVVFPVCECGVVPVIRRLLRKRVPLGMTLAYLLAAPIVNPVVILSTVLAFKGSAVGFYMPTFRLGLGVICAMIIAGIVGRTKVADALAPGSEPHEHDHNHTHAAPFATRLASAVDHAIGDFFHIAVFLMMGAAAAAVFQVLIPRATLITLGQTPGLSVFVMMLLAVGLNLCSEADAFVAASFTHFAFGAKLAFLVLGPMFDVKLLIMYFSVFRRRFIVRLVTTILLVVFVACTLVEVFVRV